MPGTLTSDRFVRSAGWRGRLGDQFRVLRHRWQRNDGQLTSAGPHDNWRRARIGALLALFVGLIALFVYHLMHKPVQVPLIAITSAPYAWPLPPNEFSDEDLDRLQALNSESLAVTDLSASWNSGERGLRALDRELSELSTRGSKSGVVVLYVSMHGAVDDTGRPMLILPSSSPWKAETWLPVAELLARIKSQNLPDEWHKLVVLDCNRMQTNWNVGLVYNSFADGLPDVVATAGVPNLVVLNSTGLGQTAFSSAELQNSIFAHYFQLGLAGAADNAAEAGNADRQVSLHELHRYAQYHVDHWAQANRADHQQPMLVPANAPDFTVAWSLNARRQSELLAEGVMLDHTEPAVKPTSVGNLWRKHEQLSREQPQRFDPLAWSDFEQKLLWLEQTLSAGRAYAGSATTVYSELKATAATFEQRNASLAVQGGAFGRANQWSTRPWKRPERLILHSLPLAGYFGQITHRQLSEVQALLGRLLESPSKTTADEIVSQLPLESDAVQMSEPHLLRLMVRDLPDSVWQKPMFTADVLRLHQRAEQAAVPDDVRAMPWIWPLLEQADAARRECNDAMFVGDDASLKIAGEALKTANARLTQVEAAAKQVADAYRLRDNSWARLPHVSAWLARPGYLEQDTRAIDTEINRTLLRLIDETKALDLRLTTPLAVDDAQALPFTEEAAAVDQKLTALAKQIDQTTKQLLSAKHPDAGTLRDVSALLALPGLPAQRREELRRLAEQTAGTLQSEYEPKTVRELQDAEAKATNPADAKNSTAQIEYLERITVRWERHPALAILATADDSPDLASQPSPATDRLSTARMGRQIRRQLNDFPARLRRFQDTWASISVSSDLARAGVGFKPANPSALGFSGRPRSAEVRDVSAVKLAANVEILPPPRPLPEADVSASPAQRTVVNDLSRPSNPHSHRGPLTQADRLARATAGFSTPAIDEDPVRSLRRFDWQTLLLAHARRSLVDLWGPIDAKFEKFFVIAATDSLAGSQALGTMNAVQNKSHEQLSSKLDFLKRASRDGVTTNAGDLLVNNDVEDVDVQVTVQSRAAPSQAADGTDAKTTTVPSNSLPAGLAAVFLRDARGRIDGTTRPLELPLAADQRTDIDYALPGAALADRGPIVQATTLFRGNAFSQSFLLRATGGIKVAFDPFEYGPPRITLTGPNRRRASVVFILDCSQTMSELVEVEAPGDRRRLSRLEVAKGALSSLLNQLAARGDARVGVRFYGHRVGWNVKKPGELMRQSDYANKIPDELTPSEDVELVLPLGRFDEVILPRVTEPMKTLKPWGETPLYLSMIGALSDFTTDDANTERSIVVITDGLNYQFNSTSPKGKSDLVAALGNRNDVKIHIVGFGIPGGDRAQAVREFGELATRTNGSYVMAESASTLVRALESLLGPSFFTVSNANSAEIGQAQVGSSVTIVPAPRQPEYFTVTLDKLSDRILLAGGEAAELAISRNQKQIEAVPYTNGDPKFAPLVASADQRPTGLMVGAHRPVWMADGVKFPISVQHEDRQFTPRPAEAWIEVVPLLPDRRTLTKYLFYDANYEPGTSAPVLSWTAESWPVAAKQAQIKVWLNSRDTAPIKTVRLDALPRGNMSGAQGTGAQTIDGVSGMNYRVLIRGGTKGESLVIGVVERLTDDNANLGDAKFEIVPPPKRVVRRFDAENRLATHMFELPGSDLRTLSEYELRITRRADIMSAAQTALEPIVLSVSDSGNVLRLTPAGGK